MSRHVEDVLEDLEWLDGAGVGAADAVRRTDFPSAEAMEKWLDRHGHYPLWLRLKGRDPVGTHTQPNRRRLMSIDTSSDQTTALLAQADKSTRARTRNRAQKIRDLLTELGPILSAERDEDEQREGARKEIEKLERQLADARARLRGGVVVDAGLSAKAVREWAADVGMDCPTRGRVPEAVRAAYEAREQAAS